MTGATVTGPAGSPAAVSVDLGAPIRITARPSTSSFNLPDGTSESITLTATNRASPGPNQFTIGATPAATAANLQTALTAAIGKLADTSLTAASAVAAGERLLRQSAAARGRSALHTATATCGRHRVRTR